MKKKLIFFDIDGTLALPGEQFSQATKEALLDLKKNGHLIFINTGRTSKDIPKYLNVIPFDGNSFSAGGRIELNNEILSHSTLSHEDVLYIKSLLDELELDYTLEGVYHNYSNRRSDIDFLLPKNKEGLNPELLRNIQENAGLSKPHPIEEFTDEPIYKINFRAPKSLDKEISELKKILEEKFRVDFFINMFSDYEFIGGEITDYSINKGKAIEILAEKLDVPIEDTIAFGDSMNDYDMLKTAGTGIAMGNSVDELKEIADIVCDTCRNDGVTKALKELKLIN